MIWTCMCVQAFIYIYLYIIFNMFCACIWYVHGNKCPNKLLNELSYFVRCCQRARSKKIWPHPRLIYNILVVSAMQRRYYWEPTSSPLDTYCTQCGVWGETQKKHTAKGLEHQVVFSPLASGRDGSNWKTLILQIFILGFTLRFFFSTELNFDFE